jgi:hypothetical protein
MRGRRFRFASDSRPITASQRIGSDSVTEVVAKKIIEVAQSGVRDSNEICRLALTQIGIPLQQRLTN